MEKNNDFLANLAKMIEVGLISSSNLKKEVENALKIKLEEILGKLNLVSREEFEVQKKIVEKLRNEIINHKSRKKKLIKKVKKVRKF